MMTGMLSFSFLNIELGTTENQLNSVTRFKNSICMIEMQTVSVRIIVDNHEK